MTKAELRDAIRYVKGEENWVNVPWRTRTFLVGVEQQIHSGGFWGIRYHTQLLEILQVMLEETE